jgi:hypothetical protein
MKLGITGSERFGFDDLAYEPIACERHSELVSKPSEPAYDVDMAWFYGVALRHSSAQALEIADMVYESQPTVRDVAC